jgi:hypothetical protein
MIERNRSDCRYIETFTYHVGSIGTPSRTCFYVKIVDLIFLRQKYNYKEHEGRKR